MRQAKKEVVIYKRDVSVFQSYFLMAKKPDAPISYNISLWSDGDFSEDD